MDLKKMKNELTVLLEEKKLLRDEMNLLNNAFIKIYFTFITITVAALGLYFQNKILPDQYLKALMFFCATQVVFFMYLFVIQMLCSTSVHAAYITFIEERIQKITKTQFSCWEKYCCFEHMYKYPSPFFIASLFQSVMIGFFSLFCTYVAFTKLNKIYAWVTLVEIIIVIRLTWSSIKYRNIVEEKISKNFHKNR